MRGWGRTTNGAWRSTPANRSRITVSRMRSTPSSRCATARSRSRRGSNAYTAPARSTRSGTTGTGWARSRHGPRPELGHRLGQHVPAHRIGHAVIGHAGADRAQAGHVSDHRPPLLPERGQRHHLRPPRTGPDQPPRMSEGLGVDRLRQRDRTGRAQRPLQRGPARGQPIQRGTPLGLGGRAAQPRQAIGQERGNVRHLVQLVARQHRQRVVRLRHHRLRPRTGLRGLPACTAGVCHAGWADWAAGRVGGSRRGRRDLRSHRAQLRRLRAGTPPRLVRGPSRTRFVATRTRRGRRR